LRRLELLDYIEALVYHARHPSEHSVHRQRINAALRHDEDRLEVEMVRRMMPDIHREEGRREGLLEGTKQMLLEQLRLRFRSVPKEVEQAVQATQDADQVAKWLRRFATATDLDSIGIVPPH
jgi:hypothetical protein